MKGKGSDEAGLEIYDVQPLPLMRNYNYANRKTKWALAQYVHFSHCKLESIADETSFINESFLRILKGIHFPGKLKGSQEIVRSPKPYTWNGRSILVWKRRLHLKPYGDNKDSSYTRYILASIFHSYI
jgi:hypothetical protein